MAARWRKQAARRNGQTARQRVVAQAVGIAARRQFDPHEKTAGRLGGARPGREGVVDQTAQTVDLPGIDTAQAAQMLRVAARLQEGAQHFAEKSRLRDRGGEFQAGDATLVAPRLHPADAKTRRQRLGVGRAQDHPAVAIEGLHRRLQRRGVLHLGIQRVLDHRHAIGLREFGEALLAGDRHAGAERVMHARHGDDGLHAFLREQQLQRVERHALIGMRRHLDHAQAEVIGE